jgi:hypothetical protein
MGFRSWYPERMPSFGAKKKGLGGNQQFEKLVGQYSRTGVSVESHG